jgi:lipopolysaccharide export system protein LptA
MKEMNPQQQKQAEEMIFDLRKEVVELNGNQ